MDIFEIIVPLVIAGIYFFGNMFSGKDKDESSPTRAPSPSGEAQDADAMERQRRIQAEIRRKIMERRRAAEGSSAAPSLPVGRRHEETERPVSHQSPSAPIDTEGSYDRKLRKRREARPREPVPSNTYSASSSSESDFSWDASGSAYQSLMQDQLKQIEATKRQAEQLKQQSGLFLEADAPKSRHSPAPIIESGRSCSVRRSIRRALKDPAIVRSAFIYAEVFGQPISQRKQSSVPGLT